MGKIDSHNPQIEHVGDNRHSPLRIVDSPVHPYEQRSQEAQEAEGKAVGKRKRRMSKQTAEKAVKDMMGRVTKRG